MGKTYRRVACILVVVGMLAVTAGCSKPAAPTPASPSPSTAPAAPKAAEPLKITLASGSIGGAWAVIAEGIAESIRRAVPGAVVSVAAGHDTGNLTRIQEGSADIALVYETSAIAAVNGQGQSKMDNVQAIGRIHPATYQFFILKSAGLTSLDQIKAKKFPLKVGVNQPGSMMETIGLAVLKEYGVTPADIEAWGGKVFKVNMGNNLDLMANGQAQAISQVGSLPFSAVQDFATKHELLLLGPSRQVIDAMVKNYDVKPVTIPAGAYTFVKEPVPSFNTYGMLVAKKGLSPDVVYTIAKVIDTNKDYLGTVHVELKGINARFMAETKVPLHPGAEKYFKEVGAR